MMQEALIAVIVLSVILAGAIGYAIGYRAHAVATEQQIAQAQYNAYRHIMLVNGAYLDRLKDALQAAKEEHDHAIGQIH